MCDEKEVVTLYTKQNCHPISTTHRDIRLLARAIGALYARGYNTFGEVKEVEDMLKNILGEKE